MGDLPGKSVGTWTSYLPELQKRGIAAVGFPWDGVADEDSMFLALRVRARAGKR